VSSEDGEIVDKIVVELDYEISPHAEKEIRKYQEIGAKVKKTLSEGIDNKAEKLWRDAENFFRKSKPGKTIDEMVGNFKAFQNKKSGKKNGGETKADDGIQRETYDVGGKVFKTVNGIIPDSMRRLLNKLRDNSKKSAEEKLIDNLYAKASAKDIKKARSNLVSGGYDVSSMSNSEVFKTDFMNRRRKEEEKIEKAAARERNKKTLAEEKKRTSLLRKTFRTFGIATKGYIVLSIAKKVLQKMGDLSDYSSQVRTSALFGNVSPEKMQAVEDWFKQKNISPEAGMKTLQSYSNFMKLNNLPVDKVLQKFVSAVQNKSPQALRGAVAHGADANTLRILRGYRGDVGKEVSEAQKSVYSDEDLKKFDRVGNAMKKFMNVIHRSKILAKLADKLANFIEGATTFMENILGLHVEIPQPQPKEISDEEFEKNKEDYLSALVKKSPKIRKLPDEPSKFTVPMNERLKAAADYLANNNSANDEKPPTDRRSSVGKPSNVSVTNTFNIRSTDPEDVAKEVKAQFSKKYFETVNTYDVYPTTVK
jgi:hypothetical protein